MECNAPPPMKPAPWGAVAE